MAGELIYANVRLRLTANRTYGLDPLYKKGSSINKKQAQAKQYVMTLHKIIYYVVS
jgi:hypothetical protein